MTTRCYALPRKVPQKAVLTEVRWREGGGMWPGGAREDTSGRQKERSPRPKVGDTVNGLAGKVHTASQSRGHGKRFGGENGGGVPRNGTPCTPQGRRGKGLGGRFGTERRYALPRNVPQKAVRAEVRFRAGEGMYHEGAWGLLRVLLVRAGAQDPLLEMRGRQVRWKCAHLLGAKEREEMEG
jgi:hypothetical protein